MTHEFPELVEIFTDPIFDVPDDLTGHDHNDLVYRRLRHVHERLGVKDPLLAHHQDYLRALLELAAMVDPHMFHVMFLHHCMTIGAVLQFGGSDGDLAELSSGTAIGAALMTELGHSNSIPNIRTEASYDPATHEFVLHTPTPAAAKFPPNVGLARLSRLAVVGARLKVANVDRGVFLFAVRLRDEAGPCAGVSIRSQPATTLLPLDYASVRFDRVRVPYESWLRDSATISADPTISADQAFQDPLGDQLARTRRSAGLSGRSPSFEPPGSSKRPPIDWPSGPRRSAGRPAVHWDSSPSAGWSTTKDWRWRSTQPAATTIFFSLRPLGAWRPVGTTNPHPCAHRTAWLPGHRRPTAGSSCSTLGNICCTGS